ncbi:hypothetical protein KSP39_PZI000964 [Platanthera zijinensis]|uniref:Secreted protein n=1 Tax=Platanthera zijinensis TaxID=2320716 RepID=A0AAP0C2B2_9ASPA
MICCYNMCLIFYFILFCFVGSNMQAARPPPLHVQPALYNMQAALHDAPEPPLHGAAQDKPKHAALKSKQPLPEPTKQPMNIFHPYGRPLSCILPPSSLSIFNIFHSCTWPATSIKLNA